MARFILPYKRLRELRQQKGLSQNDIAKFLNVTPLTYSRYESGKVGYPPKVLYKLAEFYKVSSAYLTEMTDDPYPSGEEITSEAFRSVLHGLGARVPGTNKAR